MELNTPEERIAAAIWPPDDPDFRDACNAIRLQVEREGELKKLEAFRYLMTKDGHDRASALLLRDLVLEAQKSVDQYDMRIRLMKEAQKNIRPIRP